MTDFNIFATDMDGTFLDEDGQYDKERLKRLVDRCQKAGVIFTVASGRSLVTLKRLFAEVADQIAFVAENGGVVYYQGRILFETVMTKEIYEGIVRGLRAFPACKGVLLSGAQGGYVATDSSASYVEDIKRFYDNVSLCSLTEVNDHIYKVTTQVSEEALLSCQKWLHSYLPSVSAVTTGFDALDIIPNHVNKGVGLSQLCQFLDYSPTQVIAFGDNQNDLEMLQFAGLSVAVDNARKEVKEEADLIIGHHASASVLSYMEEVLSHAGY